MRARRPPRGDAGRLAVAMIVILYTTPIHLVAQVTAVEIESRTDVLGGPSFGLAGSYEAVRGRLQFALDPEAADNHSIIDIDLAPRNDEGLVEFSTELYILQPKDPSLGNRAILFDVVNRGNKRVLTLFNRGTTSADPTTEADLGDGFLMRQGFTVVWLGWRFDVMPGNGRMRLDAPKATQDGKSIEGLVRYWFRTEAPTAVQSLDDPAGNTVPYPLASPNSVRNRLTVRRAILDERRGIPRSESAFARLEGDSVVSDAGSLYLRTGFEPGLLYEIVYETHDPPVAGLGYAAVREAISHFRYESDQLGEIEDAYAFGTSQSGRFLRGFLYEGFNADLRGRPVFDGVIANIAAAARSGFNRRFVQPSIVEPARFPFSTVAQTDSGGRDGLLARARASGTAPKLILTNSSNEYWTEWKAAAMVHTSLDGNTDLRFEDNVRLYTFAGTQHGSVGLPAAVDDGGRRRHLGNPNDYRWALRALLMALVEWDRNGSPPPESRYPRLRDGTLAPLEELAFPELPGVEVPREIVGTYRLYEGDRFAEGIVDVVPPRLGAPFPVLVPQVDQDGNELAGIRFPVVAVPLGTYTGWNLRHPRIGAPDQLARLVASYLAFPRTSAERETLEDPRPSIEERYPSRSHYLGLVSESAIELVDARLLLAEDVPAVLRQATELWDFALSLDPR